MAIQAALGKMDWCYVGPYYYDEAHFGDTTIIPGIPEVNRSAIASPTTLARIVESNRAVLGHYSAESFLRAGSSSLAVQVREPRSRLLSLYRFWQAQSVEERASWGVWGSELVARADLPLRDFLESEVTWPAVVNHLARQLCGPSYDRRRPLKRGSAKSPLSYSKLRSFLRIVDWTDCSDRFLERIFNAIGVVEPVQLEKVNVTDVKGPLEKVDPETLTILNRCTEHDRQLLDCLMEHGLLERRGPAEMDYIFEACADRLGFVL